MNAAWIIPFIVLGGALQACGAAMNGQLNKSMVNPYLAAAVSLALITFSSYWLVLRNAASSSHCLPPKEHALVGCIWWAVFGGLVGAVQVFAGLTLVNKVGTGAFMGISVSSALIASIPIEHFGWFCMSVHPVSPLRMVGGLLLVGGVSLVTRFWRTQMRCGSNVQDKFVSSIHYCATLFLKRRGAN